MLSLRATVVVHLILSLLFTLPTPLPGRRIGPADLDQTAGSNHRPLFHADTALDKHPEESKTATGLAGHDGMRTHGAANQEARKLSQAMEVAHWRRRGSIDTVQIAGSSLPDCSHACGSCSPCRLVMVSFLCASLAEAETCPMAYKCMCNSKSYPVP